MTLLAGAGERIRRPAWHAAEVVAVAPETPSARRITLRVPTWPGNDPGQHLDLRLTAADGYQASRSYSIATSGSADTLELAVDRVEDGEVSTFLVDQLEVGDRLDVNGPLGGWFVWLPPDRPDPAPVQLIAGGSGIVPLAAMIRAHVVAADETEFRLLYAVRSPERVFFRSELDAAAAARPPVELRWAWSRETPPGWPTGPRRLDLAALRDAVLPPERSPRIFICGSTPFVERVLGWLGRAGHDLRTVRAERFGGAG